MIKYINNNENLIISHVADIDGMGAVILAKLIYDNIDIILLDPDELNGIIQEIKSNNYKKIYITDIAIRDFDIYEFINNNFDNILYFDHH